ncbi:hypothetical protein L9F63_022092, partial [Diploptera punctata]
IIILGKRESFIQPFNASKFNPHNYTIIIIEKKVKMECGSAERHEILGCVTHFEKILCQCAQES